jgi:hypothetical protein
VGCEVLVFGGREKRERRFERGIVEGLDVEGVCVDLSAVSMLQRSLKVGVVYLFNPRPQETANEKLESLQLCLYND